jgi:hypothetical protein
MVPEARDPDELLYIFASLPPFRTLPNQEITNGNFMPGLSTIRCVHCNKVNTPVVAGSWKLQVLTWTTYQPWQLASSPHGFVFKSSLVL